MRIEMPRIEMPPQARKIQDDVRKLQDDVMETGRKIQDDVRETTHRAWLAGLGTVSWVEDESRELYDDGRKFFDDLVARGRKMEERGKKEVRKVEREAEREVKTLRGRLEKNVDELTDEVDRRVTNALHKMGIPTRNEIQTLTARVEELTLRLEGQMAAMETMAAKPAPAPKRIVYHVSTAEEGWKVERVGTDVPLSTHGTKQEALEAARAVAQTTTPSQVVVHRMDGTIQDNFTYDPADA